MLKRKWPEDQRKDPKSINGFIPPHYKGVTGVLPGSDNHSSSWKYFKCNLGKSAHEALYDIIPSCGHILGTREGPWVKENE